MAIVSDTYDTDTIYSGFIDQFGTPGGSSIPSNWTIQHFGGSFYVISHFLNLVDFKKLHITLVPLNQIPFPTFIRICNLTGETSDNFTVQMFEYDLLAEVMKRQDAPFNFIAIEVT